MGNCNCNCNGNEQMIDELNCLKANLEWRADFEERTDKAISILKSQNVMIGKAIEEVYAKVDIFITHPTLQMEEQINLLTAKYLERIDEEIRRIFEVHRVEFVEFCEKVVQNELELYLSHLKQKCERKENE